MPNNVKVELVSAPPGQPNAKLVLVQPNAKMPDGMVREVAPFQVKANLTLDPLCFGLLAGALLGHGLLMVIAALFNKR